MLLNCRSAVKHAADISALILAQDLDLLILTETWLNDASSPILDILVPPDYAIIRGDRPGNIGVGYCLHPSLQPNR